MILSTCRSVRVQRLVILLAVLGIGAASHAEGIRRQLEPGVVAVAKHGPQAGVEVGIEVSGSSARGLLSKYLAMESQWQAYQRPGRNFVPLTNVKPVYRRGILFAVFPRDRVDDQGWWHTAEMEGETLWSLCAWITGSGRNYGKVMAHPQNGGIRTSLSAGQEVLISRSLLKLGTAESHSWDQASEPAPELAELEELEQGLRFDSDREGAFAMYTLRRGETLYSSVVVRFTDYQQNDLVLQACEVVARRSGIRDMRDIDAGQRIRIPLYMLSDRYQPRGTPDRDRYDASIREAQELRGTRIRSEDLSDVVVILDPGHGGQDTGAKHLASGLYEDELNYDIVCRIQDILENETRARVYVTLKDRSSGLASTERKRFSHDQDEDLLTTPRHPNADGAPVSANLRWMLANSIYAKELKRGVPKEKIIFTSIHTDSLYNKSLRGAMIYIPGAELRRSEEIRKDRLYKKYAEGRSFNRFTSSSSERRRDEAMSRNFATTLLDELGKKRIKRHDNGDPIRSKIRKSRTNVFVPAVLRNTKVPTKVLIETANLENVTDRQRLADPWWRQQFAIAYVDALKRYYGTSGSASLARLSD